LIHNKLMWNLYTSVTVQTFWQRGPPKKLFWKQRSATLNAVYGHRKMTSNILLVKERAPC